MTTENNQSQTEESTVYWRPDETITIKGTELAALLHLVDLQTVAINQVPLNTLMQLFSTANSAKSDIMDRLAQEGKLSSHPIEEPQAVQESAVEEKNPNQLEIIYPDSSEISDEIL
jgi:hypothetical protein